MLAIKIVDRKGHTGLPVFALPWIASQHYFELHQLDGHFGHGHFGHAHKSVYVINCSAANAWEPYNGKSCWTFKIQMQTDAFLTNE